MKIREYYNDVRLNEDEKKYLLQKIDKIKDSILVNCKEGEIFVDLKVDQDKKKEWSLEVSFKLPKNIYQASKKGFGLTEVMDEIEEILVRQILRKKGKIQDLRERGSRSLRKKRTIDGDARF